MQSSKPQMSHLIVPEQQNTQYGSIDSPNFSEAEGTNKKRHPIVRFLIVGFAFIVLCSLAFVAVSAWIVIPKAQDYVNQSVEVDIKRIELDSITTKGINMRIEGINKVDYDAIESGYASMLFKLGGGFLRTANVKMSSIDLKTLIDINEENEEGEMVERRELITIGEVHVPEFDVNIGDGEITFLNLVISLQPDTSKILGIIRDLLQHPDKVFKIYGSTILELTLGAGFLPIHNIKINFEQEVIAGKYFQFRKDELRMRDLVINEVDSSYDIQLRLSLPNPVYHKMVTFEVPELGWELLVKDCFNESSIRFFDHDVVTKGIKLSSSKAFLDVDVETSLTQLDPRLSEQCSIHFESYTPMNHLVDQFLHNKTLPILIKNVKGSKEYPGFVNEILQSIELIINYYSNFKLSNLIDSVSLENLKFELQNGNINKPIINGEINLTINLPINSSTSNLQNLAISKIRGSSLPDIFSSVPIKLSHENEEFGEINFKDWHDCESQSDGDQLFVKFSLNQEEVVITNKAIFSRVINDLFKSGKSLVLIDAVMDCLVSTLIGEFQINGITVTSESEITRGESFWKSTF